MGNGNNNSGMTIANPADVIDVDMLEGTVGKWDTTLFEAQVLGKTVAVDPEMQNLVNAGRQYAVLRRAADAAVARLAEEEQQGCPICHTKDCTSSHK